MDIVRGFIKISGITDVNDLFNLNSVHIAQFAEKDTIYLPEDSPGIDNIFEIILKAEILSCRFIRTPAGTTIVFDGIKSLKIISTEINSEGKAKFSYIKLPFNTFIESTNVVEKLQNYEIYIIDAFFSILDAKRIYSHITYLLHLNTDIPITKREHKIEAMSKYSEHMADKEKKKENQLELTQIEQIAQKSQILEIEQIAKIEETAEIEEPAKIEEPTEVAQLQPTDVKTQFQTLVIANNCDYETEFLHVELDAEYL